jgi:hypothetical protein
MEPANQQHETRFTPVTLEALRRSLFLFAQERQWEKFHTPRNLVLALVGEVRRPDGSGRDAGFAAAVAAVVVLLLSGVLLFTEACNRQ